MSTLLFSKSETTSRHNFLLLSIDGCSYCGELWDTMETAHSLSVDGYVSMQCEKVDVTDLVRKGPETKQKFVEAMKTKYGYQTAKNGRVMFPIVIYNGRYIGGYKEGNELFCTLMRAWTLKRSQQMIIPSIY